MDARCHPCVTGPSGVMYSGPRRGCESSSRSGLGNRCAGIEVPLRADSSVRPVESAVSTWWPKDACEAPAVPSCHWILCRREGTFASTALHVSGAFM
jgi:hypothetical protein